MTFSRQPPDVDYVRLFFPEDQEETAVLLARLLLKHLDDGDRLIRPDDTLEELIGWDVRPTAGIVSFLIAMEEQEIFPKEALACVETFRELVEYVAARSRSSVNAHSRQCALLSAHNSFTNL